MTESEIGEELTSWKNEFSEAMSLFEQAVDKKVLREISQRYSVLKKRIIERSNELKKADSLGRLNEQEKLLLLPAISEVALHCNAIIGSMNKQELSSSLYDGEDYLSYHLSNLNITSN
ncbi:hypothetical protein [Pseudoalteromonas gelatinilytica]|uniref:hypothetical protein n=1 Tax=Pseudoalteromonas gelatinilytica TaxID=1703256 RepID=UPI00166A0901|nr:hypothetical protein [Pseudoalteromonas profundi]